MTTAQTEPVQLRITEKAVPVLVADLTHAITMLELCASTLEDRAPQRAQLARQAAKRLRGAR